MTADDSVTLAAAWPLFALRIRSERLVLRLPTDEDLVRLIAVAMAGIHSPDEMPFGIAWSTLPSPAFERGFLQHHWGMRAGWSPETWQLNLLIERDGEPIGSQSVHAERFAVMRTVDTGSWLGRTYQGKGYGREMRAAVLALAFDGLCARVALTEAFIDNAASSGVSRSLGYEENGRGSLAPEGIARETQRFRMTVEGWRSRPRSPVTIEGLDACRELFGA
ncbi:MAG: GNAT family N-acetyltransferase [Candidatus Limnocylindrales bacterium]|nr:GNAT family N-acetyltransferase [Candidatus Limnocylindrales bacterium]